MRLNSSALAGSGEAWTSITITVPPGAHTRTISRNTGQRIEEMMEREARQHDAEGGVCIG
jgi:hypothetical protein